MLRVLTAASLLALAACGGVAPGEITRPAISPSQGAATLAIDRTSVLIGFALEYAVLLDGEPVASLAPGGSAIVPVPAGLHEVEVRCGGGPFGASDQVTAQFDAGKHYRLNAYATFNSGCELRMERA